MIGRVAELCHQYYGQVMIWYQGADMLTQYVVVLASFIAVLMFSAMMYLSRFTR